MFSVFWNYLIGSVGNTYFDERKNGVTDCSPILELFIVGGVVNTYFESVETLKACL